MMKRNIMLSVALLMATVSARPCTNFIVGKKASVDGSVMCTYNADDYGMFLGMAHYPAGHHQAGEVLHIYDWDTQVYHGQIAQVAETYNVVGNINEWQVTIGETTFGGREEMVDTTGILDYGSLIYIALQRSKTAREAISVMTSLVEQYGYNSEGETFTICDPNEAWVMEMMGCASDRKISPERTVWVALRIPDEAICGHANQSRIRTFNRADTAHVRCSSNVVSYARKMGWYSGRDEDFVFNETYAFPDFGGRRICDARVWSFFRHYSDQMDRYLPWAEGIDAQAEPLPLWIVPNRKLSVHDLEQAMRDHYEGTPLALDDADDMGGGIWQMPYRPTPLYYTVDGKRYFNERPTSTQQTAFSYVSQMRAWLPREVGGVLWFANDDGNMAPYTPVYCCATTVPEPYNTLDANATTFSMENAFWVQNWVANMVYPRYSMMFPSLREVRDSIDNALLQAQAEIEKTALARKGIMRVSYLTDYSSEKAEQMLARWRQLAFHLIVKYNDMVVKPQDEKGEYLMTPAGAPARVERPGYPAGFARQLVRQSGRKYLRPDE